MHPHDTELAQLRTELAQREAELAQREAEAGGDSNVALRARIAAMQAETDLCKAQAAALRLQRATESAALRVCAGCASPETASGVRLRRCGGCKTALYCSEQCAVADWRDHRPACRQLRGAARSV